MTLQEHTALFVMAAAKRFQVQNGHETQGFINFLQGELPWVLLPDALRAYIDSRQASHFENLPDGTDTSWIEFPSKSVLRNLSKENFSKNVKFYIPERFPTCVIGESSNINEFDIRNFIHRHHSSLRCHLIQDCYLDAVLREKLIDVTKRFEDDYIIRHNGQHINGQKLREQITLMEELGFLKLAGIVYHTTGILMTREWFDIMVAGALKQEYPEDLFLRTYSYMGISDAFNQRIKKHLFSYTCDEIASVFITPDLDRTLNELYVYAHKATLEEI